MDDPTPSEVWMEEMEYIRFEECKGGDIGDDLVEQAIRSSTVFIVHAPSIAARELFDLYEAVSSQGWDIGIDVLTRAWVNMLHDTMAETTWGLLESEGGDPESSLVHLANVWNHLAVSCGFFGYSTGKFMRAEWAAMRGIGYLFEMIDIHRSSLSTLRDVLLRGRGKICDVLWVRREDLLDDGIVIRPGGPMEFRDMFMVTAVGHYVKVVPRRNGISSDKRRVTHLGLFLWYHLPPGMQVGSLLVGSFCIEDERGYSSNPETFLQEAIVDQFGAGPLMRRVCRDLQDKNGAFAIDLAALIRFFRMLCAHPDLHRLLFSMNAYQCVLSAMKRQIYGTNEDRRYDGEVWSQGFPLLLMCMENWAEGCVEMLICHGIVGVLAHGIELCATRSWAETEVYVRIIVKLTASAIVSAGMFSTEQHSSFKILCDDVRAVWWPALRALREMRRTAPRKEHTRLVDVWTGLGDKTGLNEEEERRRHEQGAAETMKEKLAFCAWMECEFHSTKPSHALRTCAGCNTVRYCDKVCQIRGWKEGGHKRTCKRLKA